MSVELTHNSERYMVDGGKWYRRLKSTEMLPHGYQFIEGGNWKPGNFPNTLAGPDMYRVPCVDPRPPFRVGDRVKVARKDEGCWVGAMDPCLGEVETIKSILGDGGCLLSSGYAFFPQCLDHIESKPQPNETAKMKFTQWQLREVKEPKNLEDVPDLRVIHTEETTVDYESLWFRSEGEWWYSSGSPTVFVSGVSEVPCDNWRLTDHCVELVETEVEVLE